MDRSVTLRVRLAAVMIAACGGLASGGTSGALRFDTGADLGAGDVGIATGRIDVDARLRPSGREVARIVVRAESLDATRDVSGRLPIYGVFLVPDGGDELFLGRVRLNGRGRGRLRVLGPARLFAATGAAVREFAGGVVEIRGQAGVVVRGGLAGMALAGATATTDSRRVYGHFVAFSAPQSSPGSFEFRTDESDTGVAGGSEIRNRLALRAPGLITGPKSSSYRAYVLNASRSRTVDLGELAREPWLGASLGLDTRTAALPGGIVRWSEFDGGFLEVRRGGTVMLRGSVAPLRGVRGPIADVGLAHARKNAPLTATATGGGARGILTAVMRAGPTHTQQEIRLRVVDLAASAGPFTVIATEASGTRRDLGRFATRPLAGTGGLRLSSRRGDHIPGGGVAALGGQAVEVVDSGGAVVLTATFPSLD